MAFHDCECPRSDEQATLRATREDTEPVFLTVLQGIAALENVPITELDPLYDQVDTEALTALLSHARNRDSDVTVEFAVEEYDVIVTQDGEVCVY